jgi:TolB-like protein/DNA-binding winged helix-turn-helix (wHTH) protein
MKYRFGEFELDPATVELRAEGELRRLEPQVFALIAYLVENRDRLVSRDELLEKVWDGRVVSDSALASRVKVARRALDDDGRAQRVIRTIHGRGFRFVAEVHPVRHELRIDSSVDVGRDGYPGDRSAGPSGDPTGRPSIAVLPFRPVGDAGPYAAAADALPHDLITELARLRWLFVTARGSSFRLREPTPEIVEVGRLLGVRYCLSGTVEVAGSSLFVTAELAETQTGSVVWAERYGGSIDDVHAVRAEIRSKILTALEIQIPLHEAARARLAGTENLDAWSAYHLGLQHMYHFNRRDNAVAAELFERAVAQDPGFARAHAGLSFVHFQTAFMGHAADPAEETALSRSYAQRGLDLDPLDPFVNFTMGRTYWLEGDLEKGLSWLERATSLSPNYAQGIYARAWTETLSGRALVGREHVDLAIRLSPLDPLFYGMLGTRAFTHMAEGEDLEAASWAERAARSPGAHVLIAMIAAAAQALAGHGPEAESWAREVRRRDPRLTREDFFQAFPFKSEAVATRVSAALKSLGF